MRRVGVAAAIWLLTSALAATAVAQSERTLDTVRQNVARASTATGLQIRVKWTTAEPVADPTKTENRFTVLSMQRVQTPVRPERAPQLTSTSLVVIAADESGREIDWRIIADPRIVRAEAGADALRGDRLYYLDVDFLLLVPDVPGIARLRVYRVQADRAGMLRLIGTVSLQ